MSKRKIRIIVKIDTNSQMASVRLDGRHKLSKELPGMEGNFWDFHPGCHGIEEYGDFNGVGGLVSSMKSKIEEMGFEPLVEQTEYHYPH